MRKAVLQAFVAAAVALIVPVTCALQVQPGPDMPDGRPDNGPLLGAGAFLFLIPVWLLLLSAYFAGAAGSLRLLRSLTLPKLLLLNLAPAAALGVAFGQDRVEYGMAHAVEECLRLLGWSFASFALGTVAWWLLHKRFASRAAARAGFAA